MGKKYPHFQDRQENEWYTDLISGNETYLYIFTEDDFAQHEEFVGHYALMVIHCEWHNVEHYAFISKLQYENLVDKNINAVVMRLQGLTDDMIDHFQGRTADHVDIDDSEFRTDMYLLTADDKIKFPLLVEHYGVYISYDHDNNYFPGTIASEGEWDLVISGWYE